MWNSLWHCHIDAAVMMHHHEYKGRADTHYTGLNNTWSSVLFESSSGDWFIWCGDHITGLDSSYMDLACPKGLAGLLIPSAYKETYIGQSRVRQKMEPLYVWVKTFEIYTSPLEIYITHYTLYTSPLNLLLIIQLWGWWVLSFQAGWTQQILR